MPVAEQRCEHVELPEAPLRHGSVGQVATEVTHRIERRGKRHDRDEQHHPRAQGVGAQELAPLGDGVAIVCHDGFEELHSGETNTLTKPAMLRNSTRPPRPGKQAEQADDERHTENGGQQHEFNHLSSFSCSHPSRQTSPRMRKTKDAQHHHRDDHVEEMPISTTSGIP